MLRWLFLISLLTALVISCYKPKGENGPDEMDLKENYGILEVDFELPVYRNIEKGIRRVDLAVCFTLNEMFQGNFFYRANVSDVKQFYQIYLPEGTYHYRAAITCTCGGDSCINGGFQNGYGGIKYAYDKVNIEKGKKTVAKPPFE